MGWVSPSPHSHSYPKSRNKNSKTKNKTEETRPHTARGSSSDSRNRGINPRVNCSWNRGTEPHAKRRPRTHLEHGLHGAGDAGEPVPGGLLGPAVRGRHDGLRGDGGVRDGVEERLDAAEQVAGVGGAERGDRAEAGAAGAEAGWSGEAPRRGQG